MENLELDTSFEDNANTQALEKRPEFLKELALAGTLSEIKAAVETYAVSDPLREGNKTVINFLEGAYKEENETDGSEDLEEIIAALDSFEGNPPESYSQISEKIFNYAVAGRVAELFSIID